MERTERDQVGATVPDILGRIVDRRRERLRSAPARPSALGSIPARAEVFVDRDNRFLAALSARRGSAVIAEVKMGSPRLGSLAGKLDPVVQARAYAAHGAAALSVVVEPDFFHGSYELLQACREASGLPTIAKDFIVDPLQLEWAKEAGADAILLIAALHSAGDLRAYAAAARGLGLAPLIELHAEEELGKLDGQAWELVGVNNRDLRTFAVDIENSARLAPLLPVGALRVAESGISSAQNMAVLRAAGFDAFLVGESLLTAPDPGAKLEELLS